MHFEMVRQLSPSRRIVLAFELINALRQFAIANIKFNFPEANETEVRRKFIARVLPRQQVISAYGFDPNNESDDRECSIRYPS